MSLTDPCSAEARPPGTRRGEIGLEPQLRHGGNVAITLPYELIGTGERVLIAGGGISAGRHVLASTEFPEAGWWQAQASSFGEYRLLAIDWVGADGALDQPIDPADQADAIAALLDHLEIEGADAFIGASYGGMVALQFAARQSARRWSERQALAKG